MFFSFALDELALCNMPQSQSESHLQVVKYGSLVECVALLGIMEQKEEEEGEQHEEEGDSEFEPFEMIGEQYSETINVKGICNIYVEQSQDWLKKKSL